MAKSTPRSEPRPCAVCGEIFTPIRSATAYCTTRCKNRFHQRRKAGFDVRDVTSRSCQWCDKEFAAIRCDQRYCSLKCGYLHRYGIEQATRTPNPCRDCGIPISDRGAGAYYCTSCRQQRRATWHQIGLSKKPLVRECKGCGAPFDEPQRQVFCSRVCMGRYGRAQQTAVMHERLCTACGEPFVTYDKRPKQCSTSCAQWSRHFPSVPRIRIGICGYCEQPFKANKGNQKYCGRRCVTYVGSARRRAAKRGASVEGVSRAAIAIRDKWICQLCGKRVNKHLKAPHPMSASLDHVIPIVLGGDHTRANCQLAHLGCNCSKGARIHEPLQLALIG